MTTTFKWNEETTAQVQEASADLTSYEQLEGIAEALGTTVRSVAAKLRNLGVEVPKKATATSKFTDEQADALGAYVTQNAGQFTYGEIAEAFEGGAFNAKQIQGKILAMELTANVKPTVHEKAPSKYTPEAEATIVSMAQAGSSIEDIAVAVGAEVKSVRGKALSLLKAGAIEAIPHTATPSKATSKADVFEGLDIEGSTVAELAEATGKTERGIKAMITRRKLTCADYTPKVKKEAVELQEAA